MIHPQHPITLSDFVVIVMICDDSEVSHYLGHKKITNRHEKHVRLRTKKAAIHLNWCTAVEVEKPEVVCSIMKSIKSFWKTRAYSRFFYCWFSVSRHPKKIKIKIKTILQISPESGKWKGVNIQRPSPRFGSKE